MQIQKYNKQIEKKTSGIDFNIEDYTEKWQLCWIMKDYQALY